MKHIILTILLGVTFFSCKAQTIYPLGTMPEVIQGNNYYVKDTQNVYNSIVGVWRWEQGNSYLELTFEKFEMASLIQGSTKYKDLVLGKYTYVENGNLVAEVDEIPNIQEAFPKVYLSFESPPTFWISITDIVSKKYKHGQFILNDDDTATMTLQDPLHTGGVYSPDDPPTGLEFQLPTNITLTKVE